MTTKERLTEWANKLTEEQAKKALVERVIIGMDSDNISFYEDSLAPYCSHSGEPLIEGQKTHQDDDEDEDEEAVKKAILTGTKDRMGRPLAQDKEGNVYTDTNLGVGALQIGIPSAQYTESLLSL